MVGRLLCQRFRKVGADMRISIRRLIKWILLGLGVLTVLGFIHESVYQAIASSSAGDPSDMNLQEMNPPFPLPNQVDQLRLQALDNTNIREAGLLKAVPNRDSPQQNLPDPEDKDVKAEPDVPMPHPNEAGNGVQMLRRGAGSESSLVEAYDWSVMRGLYFRGENVPDDMLAVKPPRYLKEYKNPCFYVLDPAGDVAIHGDVKVRLKCLPYFHLIGVDKSGTTDLWFRLTQHQHVARNSGVMGKETHWWSWRRFGFDIWIRNAPIRHFDWYLSHFDEPAKRIQGTTENRGNVTLHPVITGEGSPTVFWDFTGWDLMPQNIHRTPENALVTPAAIHHLTPQAKLILMLRNPVDRLFSEYLFLDRFKGRHNISAELFHEGVVKSIAMLQDCVKEHSFQACLYNKTLHMILPVRIMVGMYSVWLKQWYAVFHRHQILILRNEDYAQHMDTHLARVFDFLGLNPLSEAEMQKIVSRKRAFERSRSERAVGDMLPATRQILADFFQPYNRELADLLADDSYLWK